MEKELTAAELARNASRRATSPEKKNSDNAQT